MMSKKEKSKGQEKALVEKDAYDTFVEDIFIK